MDEERVCLECGRKLMGRADQKFCSDMCRNTYNNRQKAFTNNTIRNITNALKKNRRILEELCPEEKNKVMLKTLKEKGFDFNYQTHQRKTQKGSVYHFVFDMGYLELENDYILIVRNTN